MKKTAITLGDPNSISPEITIKALNFLDFPENEIILIANKEILDFYKKNFGLFLKKNYQIIEIPYKKENIIPGKETKDSGSFSYQALEKACSMVLNKDINAIVTAPVSKNAIKQAGYNYSGQTEIIEHFIAHSAQKAEMLFICNKSNLVSHSAAGSSPPSKCSPFEVVTQKFSLTPSAYRENFLRQFKVLLYTRHTALKDVSQFVKKNIIIDKIERLNTSFKFQLGINNPKFAICALNPHSGENGMFGDEEIKEIIPAVKELNKKGINIQGPFPSDSLFANYATGKCSYDCYIAMYHDQGLIPIKLLERDNCVNTTIGLDVLRTSPAHGTAFDIAGTNTANPSSMINAIKLAVLNS